MSSGELGATLSQMRDAASTIAASASRVQDAVNAADNEVKALGPDRFMSDGAEAFRQTYNRLTPQLKEAYESLIVFQKKLLESADEIENAARPQG